MLTALLVDDEATARNGLARHVDWEEIGIQSVKTFENARSALRYLEDHAVDIIITDIRMPEMNGIEFARLVRRSNQDCHIILISAYSDIEYYKEAIELSVESYVEKPINIESFEKKLKDVVSRINSEKAQNDQQKLASNIIIKNRTLLYSDVFNCLTKGIWNASIMDELNRKGAVIKRSDLFRLLYIKSKSVTSKTDESINEDVVLSFELPPVRHIEVQKENDVQLILLAYSVDKVNLVSSYLATLLSKSKHADTGISKKFIIYSEEVLGFEKIQRIYINTVALAQQLFYTGYGIILTTDDTQNSSYSEPDNNVVDDFKKVLYEASPAATDLFLDDCYQRFRTMRNVLPDIIKDIYFRMYMQIIDSDDSRQDLNDVTSFIWMRFAEYETLKECSDCLREQTRIYLDNQEEFSNDNQAINKIIQFTRKHIGDPNLSVKMISDHVGITPQYAIKLIKSKIGVSLGQFITKSRMERTADLLLDSALSLNEIAEDVGYYDKKYWARVFKKYYEMTPSDYRNIKTRGHHED